MHPVPMEFRPPRRGTILGFLGSLAFVLLGLGLLFVAPPRGNSRVVGALNVLFFGLCALVNAWTTFAPGEKLTLDAAGIHYRHPNPAFAFSLRWPAVESVRVATEDRSSLLTLRLHGPEGLPAHAAPEWALAKGAWPETVPPEFTLSAHGLVTTAEALAADIERFRRYYGEGRAEGRA